MEQRQFLYKFRDWLFDLLIDFLVNSGWVIEIKDFKKSEKRSERLNVGLTDYENEIIYLGKKGGTPKVLVHELCHFGLRTVLEQTSQNLPWKSLKKVKGKRRANKEREWREIRTLGFERIFYNALDQRQIDILQGLIDIAKEE